MRALVSQARPWTDAQSPQRWADGRGAVRFWNDAGVPLAESEMTTAQRRAFTAWRREVGLGVYDTAPAVVQDGVDAGVCTAVRSVRSAGLFAAGALRLDLVGDDALPVHRGPGL